MKNEKYYLVDDCIVSTDKEMKGFREVPREVIEGSCKKCRYGMEDNPMWFCVYYRKFIWNMTAIPRWCNNYTETK